VSETNPRKNEVKDGRKTRTWTGGEKRTKHNLISEEGDAGSVSISEAVTSLSGRIVCDVIHRLAKTRLKWVMESMFKCADATIRLGGRTRPF